MVAGANVTDLRIGQAYIRALKALNPVRASIAPPALYSIICRWVKRTSTAVHCCAPKPGSDSRVALNAACSRSTSAPPSATALALRGCCGLALARAFSVL